MGARMPSPRASRRDGCMPRIIGDKVTRWQGDKGDKGDKVAKQGELIVQVRRHLR